MPSLNAAHGRLFIFGDSLSDDGAGSGPSDDFSSIPFGGRASNGFLWHEQIRDGLFIAPNTTSLSAAPDLNGNLGGSLDNGVNFAHGGAITSNRSSEGPPGAVQQAQGFASLAASGDIAPPNANDLFSILIGGNDVLGAIELGTAIDTVSVIANIDQAVSILQSAGAQRFLLLALPSFGGAFLGTELAESSDTVATINEQVSAINAGIRGIVGRLNSENGEGSALFVDLEVLIQNIEAGPASFGFENVTLDCASAGISQENCQDSFFSVDGIHPTQAGHAAIATFVIETAQAMNFNLTDGLPNITATDGDDSLIGGAGQDTVRGGNGDDTIDGGGNADFLRGDAGDDRVQGGSGNDTVFAGPDDKGNDTIEGNSGDDILGGAVGDDVIVGGDLDGSDTVDAGSDTLFGGAGNDLLVGGSYDPSTGTAVNTGGGQNTIWAGVGDDTVIGDDSGDILGGGDGNDKVSGGAGADVFYGGSDDGNDTLSAGGGDDQAFAGQGTDQVTGGAGNDTLFGGAGHDMVDGDAGNDLIYGGTGDDVLTGGSGDDTFAFITGFDSDTISDFGANGETDVLDFSEIEGVALDDLLAAATFDASGVTLTIGTHGTITLEGIDQAELQTIFDSGQVVL